MNAVNTWMLAAHLKHGKPFLIARCAKEGGSKACPFALPADATACRSLWFLSKGKKRTDLWPLEKSEVARIRLSFSSIPLRVHYTLAQLKAGRQWPREWMSAPAASVDSAAFRGGGKSVSSADWRPAATPSRKSSHSWRPACTPEKSVVSRVRSCLPSKSKPRSKVASIRSPSSCHPFHAPSCKAKSVPGSSSGARARVPGHVGSQKAHHIKPQEIADQYRWTCNLCQEVFRTRMPRVPFLRRAAGTFKRCTRGKPNMSRRFSESACKLRLRVPTSP